MKTKKILLGCLVLVFAIGSAIASAFAYEMPHIIGKTEIYPEKWACVPIHNVSHCDDNQGMFECVVRIPINGILTNVLAYQGPGYLSSETQCTISLRQNYVSAQNAILLVPVYEVLNRDIPY
ncbi:hypothetical protein ED312_09805 [Sinomicrobium pectinilyticum]|uniref:Uncharacterized protein n=1 Tax=Sinomicrobium pectinilyticum TaxID=1084421 RepID=A0A3N0EIT4_SINP1|nr:DUF6520 family protein [Sinomicrobium pectinilyticum]RNL87798.1 hypothetical protein ED312_09805 [Sinomicrobium pectinilyticum]